MKIFSIIFIIFLTIVNSSLFAQWQQVSGPFGERINSFAVSDSIIYAGSFYGRIYLSSNHGSSWKQTGNDLLSKNINSLVINGNDIFAGTNQGLYISSNNGSSWKLQNSTLANINIGTIAIDGNNIYAGGSGLFYSTDNGLTWN